MRSSALPFFSSRVPDVSDICRTTIHIRREQGQEGLQRLGYDGYKEPAKNPSSFLVLKDQNTATGDPSTSLRVAPSNVEGRRVRRYEKPAGAASVCSSYPSYPSHLSNPSI